MTAFIVAVHRRVAIALLLALSCQMGAAAGVHHAAGPMQAQTPSSALHAHHTADDGSAAATTSLHCGDGAMIPNGACGDYSHPCPLCSSACGSIFLIGSASSSEALLSKQPHESSDSTAPPVLISSLYRPPNRI